MKKLYVTIMQFITMLKLKKDKCVWDVIKIRLVDTIIYYSMRMVTIVAEICRRHTRFVSITYLYALMYIC